MKNKILAPMLMFGIMSTLLISCSQEINPVTPEDPNLIVAIDEAANKHSISEGNLPSATLTTLHTEFEDTFVTEAILAPELGYKVIARVDDPSRYEERYQLYFNIDGDRLIDRDRPHDGIDWCFRIVFPITVTHVNREVYEILNYQQLKRAFRSCDRRRHCFEINYPINLQLGDRIVEINGNEQLRRAFNRCDRLDRPTDVRPHD